MDFNIIFNLDLEKLVNFAYLLNFIKYIIIIKAFKLNQHLVVMVTINHLLEFLLESLGKFFIFYKII